MKEIWPAWSNKINFRKVLLDFERPIGVGLWLSVGPRGAGRDEGEADACTEGCCSHTPVSEHTQCERKPGKIPQTSR